MKQTRLRTVTAITLAFLLSLALVPGVFAAGPSVEEHSAATEAQVEFVPGELQIVSVPSYSYSAAEKPERGQKLLMGTWKDARGTTHNQLVIRDERGRQEDGSRQTGWELYAQLGPVQRYNSGFGNKLSESSQLSGSSLTMIFPEISATNQYENPLTTDIPRPAEDMTLVAGGPEKLIMSTKDSPGVVQWKAANMNNATFYVGQGGENGYYKAEIHWVLKSTI